MHGHQWCAGKATQRRSSRHSVIVSQPRGWQYRTPHAEWTECAAPAAPAGGASTSLGPHLGCRRRRGDSGVIDRTVQHNVLPERAGQDDEGRMIRRRHAGGPGRTRWTREAIIAELAGCSAARRSTRSSRRRTVHEGSSLPHVACSDGSRGAERRRPAQREAVPVGPPARACVRRRWCGDGRGGETACAEVNSTRTTSGRWSTPAERGLASSSLPMQLRACRRPHQRQVVVTSSLRLSGNGSTAGSAANSRARVAPKSSSSSSARDLPAGLRRRTAPRGAASRGRPRGAGDTLRRGHNRLELAAHRAPPPPLDVVEVAIARGDRHDGLGGRAGSARARRRAACHGR